jgi:hypothetical protein
MRQRRIVKVIIPIFAEDLGRVIYPEYYFPGDAHITTSFLISVVETHGVFDNERIIRSIKNAPQIDYQPNNYAVKALRIVGVPHLHNEYISISSHTLYE